MPKGDSSKAGDRHQLSNLCNLTSISKLKIIKCKSKNVSQLGYLPGIRRCFGRSKIFLSCCVTRKNCTIGVRKWCLQQNYTININHNGHLLLALLGGYQKCAWSANQFNVSQRRYLTIGMVPVPYGIIVLKTLPVVIFMYRRNHITTEYSPCEPATKSMTRPVTNCFRFCPAVRRAMWGVASFSLENEGWGCGTNTGGGGDISSNKCLVSYTVYCGGSAFVCSCT